MNTRYIVCSWSGAGGTWGMGETFEQARTNWYKHGGRVKDTGHHVWKFTSELPFAPTNREATEQEADAYMGGDGSTNWIRCEREDVTNQFPLSKAKNAKAKA